MGVVDIKLDKDYTVILISRYWSVQPTYRARPWWRAERASARAPQSKEK